MRAVSLALAATALILLVDACSRAHYSVAEDGAQLAARDTLYAHPGGCRQCHDMSSTPRFQPPPVGACTTSGCHGSLSEGMTRLHGPFALGRCTDCHTPHASSQQRLLVEAQTALCVGCHGELLSCRAAGDVALRQSCASCHHAHGGERPFFLRGPAPLAFGVERAGHEGVAAR